MDQHNASPRGGKICLTDHFKPLWARNVPHFGIAHALALGVSFCSRCINLSHTMAALQLGPWLAVEIPDLLSKGLIKHKDDKPAPAQ